MRPLSENPARFQPGSRVFIGSEVDTAVEMVIASVRTQPPDRLLVGWS